MSAGVPEGILALQPEAHRLRAVAAAPEHRVSLLEPAASAWAAMVGRAAEDGVGLLAVSGFRDVPRQIAIWNRKMRARLDAGLDEAGAVADVMVYSAPPGWSRHHWGTDVDGIDAALADDARLEPEDWEAGGPCAAAAAWLAVHARDFGFVRPYDVRRRGHEPEPWHWSFLPVAAPLLDRVAAIDWAAWFAGEPFLGARRLAAAADDLLARYVLEVAPLRSRGGGS